MDAASEQTSIRATKQYKSMSFSQNNQTKPFWRQGDPSKGLKDRVEQINRYRDSTTSADELLRFLQWIILPALLIYSAVLSFSSYYSFFSNNFSEMAALVAAGMLAAVIEIGKSKMGLRAFQKPFLEGFGAIFSSPGQMLIWVGTAAFGVITFWMSIQNSTTGGKMLSQLNAQEKHQQEMVFTPNTEEIDRQIAESRKAIESHQGNKWKGIVMMPSQSAIKTETRTIEKLQAQRESAINTQRADFELHRTKVETNIEHSSNMLMAAGGYVEAIQLLVLMIIAACQAVLSGKMESASPTAAKGGIGFKQNPTAATAETDPRRPIGFHQTTYHPDPRMNQVQSPDNEIITFKHGEDMFKRIVQDGNIVGYLYRSNSESQWRTLGYSQVKAEYSTYAKRASTADPNESPRTMEKLMMWENILKSFPNHE